MADSTQSSLASGAPIKKNKQRRNHDGSRPPARTYSAFSQSGGYTSDTRHIVARPRLTEKFSYGVACCRFNGNTPQILLIQRRITYAFSAFVYGQYDISNRASIMSLLNKMTVEEKIILRKLEFRAIWSHIWISTKYDTARFRKLEDMFENNFVRDGRGTMLRDLIEGSANAGHLVWEIPKGRKREREADIHAAVREFFEETGIEKRQYYLWPTATRTNTFIDDDVRYTLKYYIARADSDISPQVRLVSASQIEEISDIRWMSIEQIRMIDIDGQRLAALVQPIFNYVKKNTWRFAT